MKKLFKLALSSMMVCTVLAGCSNTPTPVQNDFTYADTIAWDAQYDVVVAGFGAAGAVTAKTAAEEGATVLIVEKMSEGESGGNSKYAGQLFANGHGDVERTLTYYKQLAGDTDVPESMLRVIATGVANMADILANDFGADKSQFMDWTGLPVIGAMSPEYPEFEESENISLDTIHAGVSDGELYRLLKKNVTDRSDKIDVWFESPAVQLIQDPETKTIIGVKVERDGKTMNVRANNGVVLCTGGFEANAEMVENYLGLTDYAIIGALHNTGDGLRMAQEVGAGLWHMHVYEGGFGLGGTSFKVNEGERASQVAVLTLNDFNQGSLILVGTDGDRYLNESETVRHGHLYNNGVWENPQYPTTSWVVYDQAKADEIAANESMPEQFRGQVLKADTIEELASLTGMKADQLKASIENFSNYATTGIDLEFSRPADTMRAFDGQGYYAFEVLPEILNTQGGPKRNENAEILDVNGNPIPHLYSAGELGGITSEMYQGGTNLAECITFGQIAGKNAAAAKEALPVYTPASKVESTPTGLGDITDLKSEAPEIETADNEYIGTAEGMGGTLTVKVTMDGDKIAKVEVVSHTESEGISDPAIETVPDAIVEAQSTEVETVSGATVTSKAILAAVEDALTKVK